MNVFDRSMSSATASMHSIRCRYNVLYSFLSSSMDIRWCEKEEINVASCWRPMTEAEASCLLLFMMSGTI